MSDQVQLPVRRRVVARVLGERAGLVHVREVQQALPLRDRQRYLVIRDRAIFANRPITGKHPGLEKIVGSRIGGELAVAVFESIGDATFEQFWEVRDTSHRDAAFELVASRQPQRYPRDYAKQAITADRQAEQLAVRRTTAGDQRAGVIDELERLDIRNHRAEAKAAPVDVRRESPANSQAIGPGLLLDDPPRLRLPRAGPEQMVD